MRARLSPFGELADAFELLAHPWVIAELACGQLRDRAATLRLLDALPVAVQPTVGERRSAIEQHGWYGRGIGAVDAHLLASVMLTPAAMLWTRDRRLNALAHEHGVAFDDVRSP